MKNIYIKINIIRDLSSNKKNRLIYIYEKYTLYRDNRDRHISFVYDNLLIYLCSD